jgi:hypothetical protein
MGATIEAHALEHVQSQLDVANQAEETEKIEQFLIAQLLKKISSRYTP